MRRAKKKPPQISVFFKKVIKALPTLDSTSSTDTVQKCNSDRLLLFFNSQLPPSISPLVTPTFGGHGGKLAWAYEISVLA